MKYTAFSPEKLRAILEERGLTERSLAKILYGESTHQGMKSILTKNIRVQKLIDICNALETSPESLFDTEEDGDFPNNSGELNKTIPTLPPSRIQLLRQEIDGLKMLIKEKDARINDLKQALDTIAALGQITDK